LERKNPNWYRFLDSRQKKALKSPSEIWNVLEVLCRRPELMQLKQDENNPVVEA
jgi:hypothetical protein